MPRRLFRRQYLVVAVLCVSVGAAAGIAGTAAAPKQRATGAAFRANGPHHRGPFGGPPVHVDAVALNRAGDKFITVTSDMGKVKLVSGDELTITEGTKTVTYKDVTLTIPSGAKIRRNWDTAELSDLKEGDFVHVDSSADGTNVFAVDPDAMPPRRFGGMHRDEHRGPGGPPEPPF